jgi:multiple sugar transport system substrate-binding protein
LAPGAPAVCFRHRRDKTRQPAATRVASNPAVASHSAPNRNRTARGVPGFSKGGDEMKKLTRRTVLRGGIGLAATAALARPHIANAAAVTASAWWTQGFVPDEDTAFQALCADYAKQSGNKIDYSIIPFAPLRQKEVSAITSGVVPDIMEDADFEFAALQAWSDTLLDVSDVVETQKSLLTDVALAASSYYNNAAKKRSHYLVPMKSAATPFHIWRPLVEKAGFKVADLPKTWDKFVDFFGPVQKALQAQGMRHTYATGFVVSSVGVDPVNTFNSFVTAYGGKDIVTADGRFHGDDPKIKEAVVKMLTKLSTFFKDGFIPPGSRNWNDADDNNAFHSKLCVMDYDGSLSTEVAMIHDKQAYGHDMITQPLPLGNEGQVLPSQIGIFGAVIPKGAKNVTVAKEFLKYAIEPKVLNKYLKGGLGRWAPTMASIVKDDKWWLDPSDPHRSTHTRMAVLGPGFPWYEVYTPAIAEVNAEHVYQVAWADIIDKGVSPEQATENAFKRVEEIFAKYPIAQG